MIIDFKCKKCRKEFNCDVGKISLNNEEMRPVFEKNIICPSCGKLSINEVLLEKEHKQNEPGLEEILNIICVNIKNGKNPFEFKTQ